MKILLKLFKHKNQNKKETFKYLLINPSKTVVHESLFDDDSFLEVENFKTKEDMNEYIEEYVSKSQAKCLYKYKLIK